MKAKKYVPADMIGMRSGELVVTAFSHRKNYYDYWKVKCDCGAQKVIRGSCIRTKHIRSCGHLRRRHTDITGKVFGRLIAVRRLGSIKPDTEHVVSIWECHCRCGNKLPVRLTALVSGATKSCGCLRRSPKIQRMLMNQYEKRLLSIWDALQEGMTITVKDKR